MKEQNLKKYNKKNTELQLPKTALPIVGAIEHWNDIDSDKLTKTFLNSGDAARNTGISERTICQQVQNGLTAPHR